MKRPLRWGLKLAISAWAAGRLWSTFRWATSSTIISHNVSTPGISQVVGSASGWRDAADTSLRCDINFCAPSSRRGLSLPAWLQLDRRRRHLCCVATGSVGLLKAVGGGVFWRTQAGRPRVSLLWCAQHQHEHRCCKWPRRRGRHISDGNLPLLISKTLSTLLPPQSSEPSAWLNRTPAKSGRREYDP